jgi:transcriptional regulator with XRE-family HTH domain
MLKTRTRREYAAFLRHLREIREDAGVTQLDLAKRLKSTQSFVSKCERGERRLDVVELRLWCEALGASLPALITELGRKPGR